MGVRHRRYVIHLVVLVARGNIEAWVTKFLRSCFRWIFPDDEGEVGRDAVKAKGEPFRESREFEESQKFRG